MKRSMYLPLDEVTCTSEETGTSIDLDRAADVLELSAFFSSEGMVMTSSLANELSIGAEESNTESGVETAQDQEELVSGAVNWINERQHTLATSYPFRLDKDGEVLRFLAVNNSLGQAAYVLCLILSNLESVSDVFIGSGLHPDEKEVRDLRQYFQYFATAALAAEIGGKAWSFGFPRPDKSSFINKLREIWKDIRDGCVESQEGAPRQSKDDKFDIIAVRSYMDRLPGFLFAVAQVATGKDLREKSLKGHLEVFKSRWFAPQPVTVFIPYMIVPFAIRRDQFIDDVRVMGNVLHRLRVPIRVAEAEHLVKTGTMIEGYELLTEALEWLEGYRNRLPT